MAHWMPLHGFHLPFAPEWRSQDQKALVLLQGDFVVGYVKHSALNPF